MAEAGWEGAQAYGSERLLNFQSNNNLWVFDVPAAPPVSMPFQHMILKNDCNAVDAGIVLPNINEDFTGMAPDLGAYEVGAPLPHYGPREDTDFPKMKMAIPSFLPLLLLKK